MSIRLMSKIFDYEMPDLKTDDGQTVSASAASFVLLAIADHANDEGENAYPSIALLARKTKLSEPTVIKAVNALQRAGYMANKGRSRWNSSTYTIDPNMVDGKVTLVVKPLAQDGKVAMVDGKATLVKPLLTITKPSASSSLPEEAIYEPCNEDGEPLQEKKPKAKKIPNADAYNIAQALSEVTGMSLSINLPQLLKEARTLGQDDRLSPELIRIIYSPGGLWYQEDWRGKANQKPRLYEIRETIFAFEPKTKRKTIRGGVKSRK